MAWMRGGGRFSRCLPAAKMLLGGRFSGLTCQMKGAMSASAWPAMYKPFDNSDRAAFAHPKIVSGSNVVSFQSVWTCTSHPNRETT